MYTVPGNIPGASNALKIQIPCIVFFIVTPIFLTIRIWSRFQRGHKIGPDDLAIAASFVFAELVSALMMVSCAYGFGQHIKNLSVDNRLMALKVFYIAQIFYKLTINMTKTSILLLYLRIFTQKWFRICCYILLGIVIGYMIAATCASIWQCTPIPRAWDKRIPGTCISITQNWYANAGYSIATDILILVLPLHPIYTSALPRTQKIALMAVFLLGGFVTITSIFRMQTIDFSTTSPDMTYDVLSTIWTIIEEHLAIVCACMPMCRLPLTYLFPTLFATSNKSSVNSNPHHHGSGAFGHGGTGGGGSSHQRSAHRSFRHAGTGRNDWMPDEKDTGGGIRMTNVAARGGGGQSIDSDDTSEKYILSTPPLRYQASGEALSSSHRHGGRMTPDIESGMAGSIQKTTQYEVTYEDAERRQQQGQRPSY